MEIKDVETTLQEVIKITDIGERMLYWREFKRSFDKLSPEEKEVRRQQSRAKARELVAETYTLLGKEMPAMSPLA